MKKPMMKILKNWWRRLAVYDLYLIGKDWLKNEIETTMEEILEQKGYK